LTFVRVSTSQPFSSLLSQSAKPMLHAAMWQTPIVQAAVPLATVHVLPQRPQSLTLVRVSTSQPSAGSMLQSANPSLQRKPHTPSLHVAVAFAGTGQGFPQRPQ
jgi:hypothetical protein